MAYGDEDRATFLDDFGAEIKYGTKITKGNFDQEERIETDESGLNVVTQESVVLVTAKDFETGQALYGLAVDDMIKIDDVEYRVHDIRKVDDAAFKQLVVAEV